ncbi:hypothetical protein D3Z29_08370 [Rodentibacter pneumotropicus]|nr:hypothetical protein [Rodentibacter pneumotropicus]
MRVANSKQQTANSKQQTANSKQQTANSIASCQPLLFIIKTQDTVVFKSSSLCLEFFSFLKISQRYLNLK